MKVIVIGGGLGGLCLANGLHEEGIEVRVFERHVSADADRQGYFIHFEGNGLRALQRCLSEAGWKDFLATSTPTGAQWAFRDPQLQLLAMRDDVEITGKPLDVVERRAIERWELRGVLLNALAVDLSTIVQWNKNFTHYENVGNGRVRAHFADGTSEEGDVLIGADGSKSKVRDQRLPHIQRVDLGIVAIVGKYILDAISEKELPELMTDSSLNNLVPYGNGWMFVSSWRSRETQPDQHREEPEAYTLWAYFVPKHLTPSRSKQMQASELRDMALAGVKGWAPEIESIVREADLDQITPVHFQCAPHLEYWEPSNVTVLGDAIHNMTPAAGVGANTALRDGHNLTDLLAQAAAGNMSVVDAIGKYEAMMRPYANAAVALSRQIAEGAASPSWIQRFVFRTVLWLASVSPLVMRNTIGRGAVESYMKNLDN